jgi:hypothetical protein
LSKRATLNRAWKKQIDQSKEDREKEANVNPSGHFGLDFRYFATGGDQQQEDVEQRVGQLEQTVHQQQREIESTKVSEQEEKGGG